MMLWHDVLDRHMEERKIIIIISNHLVKPTGYLTTFSSSLHQYGMYYHMQRPSMRRPHEPLSWLGRLEWLNSAKRVDI